MIDEHDYSAYVQKTHDQVGRFTDYEYLESLQELWHFDESDQPQQTKVSCHSDYSEKFSWRECLRAHTLIYAICDAEERDGNWTDQVCPEIARRILPCNGSQIHNKRALVIESSEKVYNDLENEPNVNEYFEIVKGAWSIYVERYHERNVQRDYKQDDKGDTIHHCPEIGIRHDQVCIIFKAIDSLDLFLITFFLIYVMLQLLINHVERIKLTLEALDVLLLYWQAPIAWGILFIVITY